MKSKFSGSLRTLQSQLLLILKGRKKVKIRNEYNHAPHLTQNNAWESDKNTLKHHIQERERSGSVVECLTQDKGAVGLSLTGVTVW